MSKNGLSTSTPRVPKMRIADLSAIEHDDTFELIHPASTRKRRTLSDASSLSNRTFTKRRRSEYDAVQIQNVELRHQLEEMQHSLKQSKEMLVSYKHGLTDQARQIRQLSSISINRTSVEINDQSLHNSTIEKSNNLQQAIEVYSEILCSFQNDISRIWIIH